MKAQGGLAQAFTSPASAWQTWRKYSLRPSMFRAFSCRAVQVATDYPAISCMASQCAMWQIKADKYFAMGSGPARVLARKTSDLYEKMGLRSSRMSAVIVLESNKLPDEKVSALIAEKCRHRPC